MLPAAAFNYKKIKKDHLFDRNLHYDTARSYLRLD
ncbi:MAG: hypothetical protein BWZ11_01480 [Bacteroidetes bacterium ADurb.BinA395]|nr:MAG: hypothetical protein BWZ11_01480 [Bacteroidetes bacterium ADurb.BinA395]